MHIVNESKMLFNQTVYLKNPAIMRNPMKRVNQKLEEHIARMQKIWRQPASITKKHINTILSTLKVIVEKNILVP